MASPKFRVKHLVACRDLDLINLDTFLLAYRLDGVAYTYALPPDAEAPEVDFWLYGRLYLTNNVPGRRRLIVQVYWHTLSSQRRLIGTYDVGDVEFRTDPPVAHFATSLSGLRILNRGKYEFRLLCRYRRKGVVEHRMVGSEFIKIE